MRRESKGRGRGRAGYVIRYVIGGGGGDGGAAFLGGLTNGRTRTFGRSGMRPTTEGRKKVQPRFAHESESAGEGGEKE